MAYYVPACRLDPAPAITGSWNSTGLHGHVLAKERGDVRDLYRQLAKPQQPCVFQKRIQRPSDEHVFSKHDNRNAISHLEAGFGKRKLSSWNTQGQKDLLMWMPMKDEFEKADPLLSTYSRSYRGIPLDRHSLEQKFVPRLNLLYADRPLESTYRFDIGQQNPHRLPGATCLPLPNTNRLLKVTPSSETVASCLCWERPLPCHKLFQPIPERKSSFVKAEYVVCDEKPCGQACIY